MGMTPSSRVLQGRSPLHMVLGAERNAFWRGAQSVSAVRLAARPGSAAPDVPDEWSGFASFLADGRFADVQLVGVVLPLVVIERGSSHSAVALRTVISTTDIVRRSCCAGTPHCTGSTL